MSNFTANKESTTPLMTDNAGIKRNANINMMRTGCRGNICRDTIEDNEKKDTYLQNLPKPKSDILINSQSRSSARVTRDRQANMNKFKS